MRAVYEMLICIDSGRSRNDMHSQGSFELKILPGPLYRVKAIDHKQHLCMLPCTARAVTTHRSRMLKYISATFQMTRY
jgi:hypothetical protein